MPVSERDTTNSGTILVLSQVYPPDPASVGQHMHDAAAELARRGHPVRVVTADSGYEDPTKKYARREVRDGVDVRRKPFSSFGKKSLLTRGIGMTTFMLQCLWAGFTTPRLSRIVVSTSPPMCGLAAAIVSMARGVPFVYWVMDMNPDQLIALGKTKPGSLVARTLNSIQRFVLARASHIVVLDRFMAERLCRKRDVAGKMSVFPPWPHEDALEVVRHDENPFRREHGLEGRFVLMYSGNHGFSTPVGALLDAAERLLGPGDDRAHFMFIGGGVRKREVDARVKEKQPRNVRSLPYQPIESLRFSLSAADVHMVTMEADVVGIVHPCKIYGAMAVARPILLLGPAECHAADILRESEIGWHIDTTDPDEIARSVRRILSTDRRTLEEMGRRASSLVQGKFSKEALCGWFCDIVEGRTGRVPEAWRPRANPMATPAVTAA